jgi:predicted N-formylglutamate amidohydrolase
MPIGEAEYSMTAETVALLAPDEPPAVIEYRADGQSPFLLVCDHAGRRIPRALQNLGLSAAGLARHIAWDIGIVGVGRHLADRLDACLIMQPYSRLVIDCNRPPGTPESIARSSEGTSIPGNEKVSAAEAALRVREIFDPYHGSIARHLDARKKAKRLVILISLHSFTPVYGGVARVWQAGVLYNRYNALAVSLRDLLRSERDLIVGDNEPYTVDDETDYTIPVHGEQRGIAHVAIEIRQDLIGDENGQRVWAERLAQALPKAEAKI